MSYKLYAALALVFTIQFSIAQELDSIKKIHNILDSIYISEVELKKGKPKVLHAEPLYIDLIRDLGARKGEKEWNLGVGLTDNLTFDTYEALIEYEFAPIDRLGLEIELPFLIYAPREGIEEVKTPGSRLESLKAAAQWTFLVLPERNVSMALGYIHQFEFSPFREFGNPFLKGNVYNPFIVAAKRFGNHFHTLLYTGPKFEQPIKSNHWHASYDVNTNFHFMIPGTRNFIGVELNKTFYGSDFDMIIRPQMRLGITEHLLLGIVSGIPVSRENQRISMFSRLIWEPPYKSKHKKK
jgi:hypothetical protein